MNDLILRTRAFGVGAYRRFKDFWKDEDGMGTVEVILIIVVLIGLVIIFKKEISGIVDDVFKAIRRDTRAIIS
ncbi:Flp1 family type IVb pilin [Butyrivibrio sp. MC2021]|uniref:Flp1 family type IVb pilin n=1 Tax=Butyrivibrio sp. MC2021 TaxID=1408306 RepID=UPI000567DC8E|nr:Flp1 family type IVb pilin [Butyrivibrio sp. MC2021]